MAERKTLLAILEMGGYPNFLPLYQRAGFDVEVVNSQRKARNLLKKQVPDAIVAEYNFQSQFRDRTSNLETLMAVLQKHPETKVIVFYDASHGHKFEILKQRFPVHAALAFPIDAERLESVLNDIAQEA